MSKHFLISRAGTPLTNSQGQFLYEHITLPTEYQEVEYIATTGTQYIDTGYVFKSNKFQLDIVTQFTGSSIGNFATFAGFMKTDSSSPRMGIHYYSSKYMYGANATVYNENVTPDKKKNILICTGNGSSQSLIVNGVAATATGSYDISSNALSMWIGARNNSGSPVNNISARFYRVKLSANGVKVRDMIPCYRKSDGVIGMYDTVNGAFYINKGTGSFTKGVDVLDLPSAYQRVEYVSSNTTVGQYIDTGVIPSYVNGFKISMDFAPTALGVRYGTIATYNQGTGQMSFEINAANQLRFWLNGGERDIKSTGLVTTDRNNLQFYYDGTKYIAQVNGIIQTGSYTVTTVPDYSMWMFLDRAKRTTTYTKPLKIYDCKIWVGDELLRHFVPCYRKSDNVIGMYDIANAKFYTNQGTGSFTKGSNISN